MPKLIVILFVLFVVGIVVYVGAGQLKNVFTFKGVGNSLLWRRPPEGSAIKQGEVSVGGSTTSGGERFSTREENARVSPTPTPPYGFTVAELSPLYNQVQIAGIHRGTTASDLSSFTLRANVKTTEGADVTRWTLKMYKGSVEVPRGIHDLPPSLSGTEKDIMLKSGDSLTVYSGRSPLSLNFRLNKCTGYLNQSIRFLPALPNTCPSINREEITNFSGTCQSLLLSLGSCRAPTPDQINSIAFDAACRAYVDRINYGGCYNRTHASADFFSREWRTWVLQDFPFDKSHDRILLFDTKGLLVDEYTY